MRQETGPLVPSWFWNPPRWILWWIWLIGIACVQVVLAVSGRWTLRHTMSFPFAVAAVVVLHPVMTKKLPIFCVDLIRSWRTYVFAGLVVVVNLIEMSGSV